MEKSFFMHRRWSWNWSGDFNEFARESFRIVLGARNRDRLSGLPLKYDFC